LHRLWQKDRIILRIILRITGPDEEPITGASRDRENGGVDGTEVKILWAYYTKKSWVGLLVPP
jgi:hypothetical protein